MVKTARKVSDITNRITDCFVILFFLIVIVCTSIQVFSRYVMNYSFSWTEEAARFAFIWLNMLGACVCVKMGSHAVITILVDLLPAGIRRIVHILTQLLILYAASIMVTQGMKVVTVTMMQPSPALRIPMSFIYACVPVAGVIILIHTIVSVIALLFPQGGEE